MASDSETSSPSGIMASRSMTEPFEHRAATSCVVACRAPSLAGSGHFGDPKTCFMFTDSNRGCIEYTGAALHDDSVPALTGPVRDLPPRSWERRDREVCHLPSRSGPRNDGGSRAIPQGEQRRDGRSEERRIKPGTAVMFTSGLYEAFDVPIPTATQAPMPESSAQFSDPSWSVPERVAPTSQNNRSSHAFPDGIHCAGSDDVEPNFPGSTENEILAFN